MTVATVIAWVLIALVGGAFVIVSTWHMIDRIRFGDPASWPPPAPFDASKFTAKSAYETLHLPQADSDGGECD